MKIKLAHILTETSHEREIESMKSLSPLGDLGIEYIPQINERYVGEEYKHHLPVYTGNHGPGHYGAFQSFRKAVLENFTEDVDILMLIGGDVVTDMSADDLYDKVMEAYNIAQLCDARMANFDEPIYMSGGDWWKMSMTLA
mgnify:CR=1 FL=1